MKPPSEGTASAQAINAAIDVRELHGPEAVDSILSDFADLEPVPMEQDPKQPTFQESQRHALRAEMKGTK